MDFAKRELEKYGWKDGKGLGKNEDGISEALKPKLKFDNTGIGHDAGEQFTNNWWDKLYNNAAKNINVVKNDTGIQLKLNNEPVEITTKSYSIKELKTQENFQYGSFLKTAKLTENGTENYNVVVPEALPSFTPLTDEELFAACGGRTAHKGARHGLKLKGKLSRIEKQEKMLLKKMRNVSITDNSKLEKKVKKIKKHKEEACAINELVDVPQKKKNKRKSVTFNDETMVKYYTPDLDTSVESTNEDNLNIPDLNSNDEGIEQDIEQNCNEKVDQTSFEEPQVTGRDLSKAERKKLKKKRKLELKNATATGQFIAEVRESILSENCKKRKLLEEREEVDKVYVSKRAKKQKYEKKLRKKEKKRERRMMKSIVKSLGNFCKISDDE